MSALALRASAWRDGFSQTWPGLLLASTIAIAATFIAENRGGPTLLYALLLGMALNPVASEGRSMPGVDFAARRVLRFGVALLGARITFDQIGTLGWGNGRARAGRGRGDDRLRDARRARVRTIVPLRGATGGATAICGASAAIAIAAVLPRDEKSERELVFTVAGVTALSTLAMILYPPLAKALGLDAHETGVFLGGTIHDVAQVVGAGYSVSPEAGDSAVLTKMLRVAMLLPVVMALSIVVRRRARDARARRSDPLLPPFLLVFVALIAAGSFGLVAKPVASAMNDIARGCLVVAIAAVGLKTSPLEMRKVGGRAIALLAVEALFLAALVVAVLKLA